MIKSETKEAVKQSSRNVGATVRQKVVDGAVHVKDIVATGLGGAASFAKGLVLGKVPEQKQS